jgi:hypothetical protein
MKSLFALISLFLILSCNKSAAPECTDCSDTYPTMQSEDPPTSDRRDVRQDQPSLPGSIANPVSCNEGETCALVDGDDLSADDLADCDGTIGTSCPAGFLTSCAFSTSRFQGQLYIYDSEALEYCDNSEYSSSDDWEEYSSYNYPVSSSSVVLPVAAASYLMEDGLDISVALTASRQNVTIYDDGGASGDYSSNVISRIVFTPPAGTIAYIVFMDFELEDYYDFLEINGTSYTGYPSTVYSSNSNGSLELYFTSDGSDTYSGFEAMVSYE